MNTFLCKQNNSNCNIDNICNTTIIAMKNITDVWIVVMYQSDNTI